MGQERIRKLYVQSTQEYLTALAFTDTEEAVKLSEELLLTCLALLKGLYSDENIKEYLNSAMDCEELVIKFDTTDLQGRKPAKQ